MMKLRTRVANERLSKTHKHFDTARTLLERLQILEMYYLGLITAALTFSAEKQSSKLNNNNIFFNFSKCLETLSRYLKYLA